MERVAQQQATRRHLRALAIAALVVTVVAAVVGGGYAVGVSPFDQWGGPQAPKRVGDRVVVAAEDEWIVYAWETTRGICMGLSIDDEPRASGCGMPVIGAPPDRVFPQPPYEHVIGLLISGAGKKRAGQERAYVMGPISASVSRVVVEVLDGRVLDAETFDPPKELNSPLRFYVLPLADPPWRSAEAPQPRPVSPVSAVSAFDSNGVRLERSTFGA